MSMQSDDCNRNRGSGVQQPTSESLADRVWALSDARWRTDDVLDDVATERSRQDAKWGEQNHDPAMWLAILTEEVGEVAKEIAEGRIGPFSHHKYRTELIHVAAVAVGAIESMERNA